MASSLDDFNKGELVNGLGVKYSEVRAALRPRYLRAWAELLAGHAGLGLSAACVVWSQAALGPWAIVAVPVGASCVGYGVAYIYLFMHEAGHYNLAADRKLNDLLTNVFIGSLVGQDVRDYRPLHWEHHRSIGTPADTERSYFQALDARFILESLTGVRLLKVVLGRARDLSKKDTSETASVPGKQPKRSLVSRQVMAGLALHGAILGGAVLSGQWALAGAWTLGVGAVFPFFAGLRQVLEHRSLEASPDVDYSKVPHGEVNRMFGDGWFARTFGGAGFNRHLLHHWDPQLAYTRLAELEEFLMDTAAAPVLRAAQTSYWDTFRGLMRAGARHA
jgi:fatty acid desaturase